MEMTIEQQRAMAMAAARLRLQQQSSEPEPSTYQKVREFVTPTVEALGAIGGGALGATAGTFGAGPVGAVVGGVTGAGLGYGIAKEGLEAADVYFGGKAPRKGAAQVVEPVKNIIEGAAMEAGGQVLGKGLGYAIGKVADLRQVPAQKAAKIARNALGEDLPQVINVLRNAPANANVAEITAKFENPGWQALIENALAKDSQFVRKLRLMDESESLNALTKLAGGQTAAETRAVGETAKSNINKITTPMRESALSRANLGKGVADEAQQRAAHDIATRIGTGSVIEPAEFVAQAAGAEKTLRSFGIKPLEGASLADKIAAIPKNPSFAENDLIEGAATNVADAIRKWTGSNGVIDANALEAIRKNAIDATIAKMRPGADATTQRNLAAKVMSNIKPLIDDAIEGAGGSGWRDYLQAHTKGMQLVNEKKLTGEALRLWKTDKDAFVRLVQNESPDVVEKFLGPGNYNIANELADSTLSVLQKEAEKHLTKMSVKQQVGEGGETLSKLLKQEASRFRFPSFLSFWASAGNKTLSELERNIGTKTMDKLTEAMKTPEGAANLLETLPAVERNHVLKLISDPATLQSGKFASKELGLKGYEDAQAAANRAQRSANALRTGATVGTVNALSPQRIELSGMANKE